MTDRVAANTIRPSDVPNFPAGHHLVNGGTKSARVDHVHYTRVRHAVGGLFILLGCVQPKQTSSGFVSTAASEDGAAGRGTEPNPTGLEVSTSKDGAAESPDGDAAQSSTLGSCGFKVEEIVRKPIAFEEPPLESARFAMSGDGRHATLAYYACDSGLSLVELAQKDPRPVLREAASVPCKEPAAIAVSQLGDGIVAWTDSANGRVKLAPTVEQSPVTTIGTNAVDVLLWGREGGGFVGLTTPDAGLQILPVDGDDVIGQIEVGPSARHAVVTELYNAGAVIGWVGSSNDGEPAIFARGVTAEGDPVGEATLLTSVVGPASSIDLTPAPDGATAVYTTDSDGMTSVRLQRLDERGARLGGAFGVVTRPASGRDASIARRADDTLVVAYRSPPVNDSERWSLRVAMVDRDMEVASDFAVATTSPNGGLTRITSLVTGALIIGWIDETVAGATLRAAKLTPDCEE